MADPLLKACMFDLINSLINNPEQQEKMLPVANTLFQMLELDVIWSQLAGFWSRFGNLNDPAACSKDIQAVSFAIVNLSVCDESSMMIHLLVTLHIILKRLFENYSALHPSTVTELFDLCLLLLAKASSTQETSSLTLPADMIDDSDALASSLLNGSPFERSLSISDILMLIKSSLAMILGHSDKIVCFAGEEADLKIDVFTKASVTIKVLLQRLPFDGDVLKDIGYEKWITSEAASMTETENNHIISALIEQLSDHHLFWSLNHTSLVKEALIWGLLPKLWNLIAVDDREISLIAPLIARVCHVFPKDADVAFAKLLSESLRKRQFGVLERFSSFWDHCMSGNMLYSVPLRLTITMLTDTLTADDYKFRKCAHGWIYTLCKHLDRLLDPSLLTLADVIECGFNADFKTEKRLLSTASPQLENLNRKHFKASFDKGVVVYYLDLIGRVLDFSYDGVVNFLQGREVTPYVLNQWLAFEESLKRSLQIEVSTGPAVGKRSYFNFLLVLMVPLLLLEEIPDAFSLQPAGVKTHALKLLSSLGRCANADSSTILNVLISLSIDKLSVAVACNTGSDVEKQVSLLQFFMVLFENEFVAGLFDREDILALAELCRKALKGVRDIDIVQSWSDFVISIAFLPRSEVELIPAIMQDSLHVRLTVALTENCSINEALLTALINSTAKLTVFYFASKTLSASSRSKSTSHLRKSVSGLLTDTVQDIASMPFDARANSSLNLQALEAVLFAFLEVHYWLNKFRLDEIGGGAWSQCLIVLGDTCRQLYLMNQAVFSQQLVAIFMKHHSDDKQYNFLSFFGMFYAGDGVEFLRSVWQSLRVSKDSVIKQ